MAGWKLRKDKTAAETPGAEPETAAPTEPAGNGTQNGEEPVFLNSVPGIPDFDSDTDLHGNRHADTLHTNLDFDSDDEPLMDDEPLKLVDYSEPGSETPFRTDPAMEAPALAMPPPIIPAEDFQERLRTGRFDAGELASVSDFGALELSSGIPSVAPFVLDTPIAVAPPAPAPQLTVHLGGLAAAFTLTKDVTTIGRPDSVLHYYPDVEIELDDAVSRRHAEILKHEDGFYLTDTGSTNGTMLNGEVLPPHQEHLLARGDRIRIGDRTEIVFE